MGNFIVDLFKRSSNETLRRRVSTLEEDLIKLRTEYSILEGVKAALLKEFDEEKEKSKALYEQLSESSREIKEKERIISEKDLLLRKRNSAIGSYKGTINRLRTEIEELKKKKA